MRRFGWTLVAIIVVFLCAAYIDLPQTHSFFGIPAQIRKGLDLDGGARLLLCANKGEHPSSSDMSTARDVINARAAGGLGVTEPQVAIVNGNCVSVEMPGLSDKNRASIIKTIGETGYLAITDSGAQSLNPGTKVTLVCKAVGAECPAHTKVGVTNTSATPKPILQIIVQGKYVSRGSAQVGYDNAGSPVVNYQLNDPGSSDWCNYTSANVNKFSAIVLDGEVKSDPQIQSAICGGQTQITGLTLTDAKNISTFLNYGALPVAMHVDSSEQVAATLGPQYVHDATLAAVIGLIIVAIFMLLYYRLPGLLADVALIMYAAVVFALFKLIGVTLTLAGIAGFVLSIGMAVDANVLIFERMREELRAGKTLGAAVEAGFSRAFPSIRDSNASTVITTVILFWFGHTFAATEITGFATTLFLGVVVSFITAVFVSHTFLRLLVSWTGARQPALYGVEAITGGRVA